MIVDLIGYTDKLSGRPGDTINFKVSSQLDAPVKAQLLRSICADANPAGMGIVETNCDDLFTPQQFTAKNQPFQSGSFAKTAIPLQHHAKDNIQISVSVFPTLLTADSQTILSIGETRLDLDASGLVSFTTQQDQITCKTALTLHKWHMITAHIKVNGELRLSVRRLDNDNSETVTQQSNTASDIINLDGLVCLAAMIGAQGPSQFFNGKIEAPSISADNTAIASWNLATNMNSLKVPSALAHSDSDHSLTLVNAPTRAVCGSKWDASELNWRHKPEHYAAIHFHDDDIYDFDWETSFSFSIPDNMPSGIYVMRITCGDHEDAMPFFVCPPKGIRRAKLCVLVSTFTYAIYGNHARPDYVPAWQERIKEWGAYPHNPAAYPQYGLSTYNNHSDGAGICHASHKRPLFNLRPGYITFGAANCSGLRHFQADSHLIAWLHNQNIDYDIITDDEIDRDGLAAIAGYDAVTTGTHPEYHTSNTLDALTAYRDAGGALIYLGGNGFYWRIVRHTEDPDLLEIRRAEDGLRAWASEPGEYYNGFDGSYGGLWRRNGRPPQKLVGIGFTAQGVFEGMPYKRVCDDSTFDWVFDGIDDGPIGDFGFSGNGAAGFELDRIDTKLDEGQEITILAQSYDTRDTFMLVPEEQLTHLTNLSGGSESEAKRADMVYFKTPSGGQVFSVGSITFCGSLPWNNFDNNVSRLLRNVIDRFTGVR
ncbi:N,N-dimethylformamidase beta subunit family domain-containing protein [Candidatus Puniceispirillum marinum]|uniref:Probable N,N-dimethylformamidase large subunit n=1 Tax=Puniceispirillum marinum (strain IMCC1322) TaxID=488538 RepID=D5BRE4_PUNMI|nr:N,N-dimethylformamidase beta subunit family domain-containing protein [Candidatus Puniceispirillum marinum]ADE38841.1 probable N,N-dimethylformamidase large subunit [Candidatus Puniceispirillum marinum IMCC1322]